MASQAASFAMSGARLWYGVWPSHLGHTLDYPLEPAWWILGRNVERFPDRTAIRQMDSMSGTEIGALTYRQLYDKAAGMASWLQAAGLRRGDRALLYLPNSPELIAAYYGVWMAGGVTVSCSPMAKDEELALEAEDSGAAFLLCTPESAPRAAAVAQRAEAKLAIVGGPAVNAADGALTLDFQQIEAPGGWEPVADFDVQSDVAALLYTGGTTGVPKGAMLTHYNVVANTLQFATWYDFAQGEEICISLLPLFHSGGFSGAMNVPLSSGATLLLMQHMNPSAVARAIQEHRATRFFGVPTHYIMLLEDPASRQYDLSSLRACRTSAAPLPPSVKEAFDRRVGHEVLVEGYGLTEASPLTHANPISQPRAGSIGVPLPDTDAKVVGSSDSNEEGELWLRGPQIMKGYWNKPAETANVLVDGWLRTGDIARMDADGYFYIVDRLKDVINTAGFKVWPREVEETLYRHEAVRLAAVIGVADELRGEAVQAFVVLRDGAQATEGELIAFCKKHLAAYKVPRRIEFRDELPTSGAGKILRRQLRS